MAGFRTHITTSGFLGVAYGGVAYAFFDMPLPTCVLAGGLCGVSGMLPDVDSHTGIPVRESMGFAAAVVPMLMIERFQSMGLSHESMVLAGALVYVLIRFGFTRFLKHYTVHRGMFHSLPAALIMGELAFLICQCHDINVRYYKAGAVILGYMSHLLLDELYSIEWYRGRMRLKKSFGTAVKLWGRSTWANLSTYVKLALLTFVVLNDSVWMENFGPHLHDDIHHTAEQVTDESFMR
jgi:membrane-bound metal-dependent hydrolase YbcI (DUF457 family)